jgi:hypothetical protein
VRQQAAILSVDLSGFTGLTESLGPAWTRDLLVELHERSGWRTGRRARVGAAVRFGKFGHVAVYAAGGNGRQPVNGAPSGHIRNRLASLDSCQRGVP